MEDKTFDDIKTTHYIELKYWWPNSDYFSFVIKIMRRKSGIVTASEQGGYGQLEKYPVNIEAIPENRFQRFLKELTEFNPINLKNTHLDQTIESYAPKFKYFQHGTEMESFEIEDYDWLQPNFDSLKDIMYGIFEHDDEDKSAEFKNVLREYLEKHEQELPSWEIESIKRML